MTRASTTLAAFAFASVVATASVTPAIAAPKGSKECLDAYVSGQERKVERRLVEARAALEICARSTCPKDIARECTTWLAETKNALPTFVVVPIDESGGALANARLSLDGKPEVPLSAAAIELDPGAHQLRVEADGHDAGRASFEAVAGKKGTRVEVRLARTKAAAPPPQTTIATSPSPPPPAARQIPTDTWVWLGLGVVFAGGGTYFALSTRQRHDDLASSCRPTCPHDEVSSLRTRALIADVGFGLGAVLVGTGVYRLLTAPVGSTTVSIGPGHAVWAGSF